LQLVHCLTSGGAVRCGEQKQFGGEVWEIGRGCESCRSKADNVSALKVRVSSRRGGLKVTTDQGWRLNLARGSAEMRHLPDGALLRPRVPEEGLARPQA
jgi:hypothetical protein